MGLLRASTFGLALLIVGCAGASSVATPALPPRETASRTSVPSASDLRPTPTRTGHSPAPTVSASVIGSVGPTHSAGPSATDDAGSTAVAWSQLTTTDGPAPREDHTWTVTGDGSSAYLFGGRAGGEAFVDLWRYDLATDQWAELAPAGAIPAARFGHTAAWVDTIGLVVWSGQQGSRFFGDIWAYEPAANEWRELPSAGAAPPARYGSCASIGPDGRMWISHGFTADTGRFADTRAYDFASGAWTDMTPSAGERPVERCLHDCVWSNDGRLVLYAGQTTGAPAIGDLWTYSFDAGAWTEAALPEPQPRQLYALAKLDDSTFIFGGANPDGALLNDVWRLEVDTEALTWSSPRVEGTPPAGRFAAGLIADAEGDRLLLFGGKGDGAELADLWQLEPAP